MPMAKKTPPSGPRKPQLQTSHKRVGMRAVTPNTVSNQATRVQVARKGAR